MPSALSGKFTEQGGLTLIFFANVVTGIRRRSTARPTLQENITISTTNILFMIHFYIKKKKKKKKKK